MKKLFLLLVAFALVMGLTANVYAQISPDTHGGEIDKPVDPADQPVDPVDPVDPPVDPVEKPVSPDTVDEPATDKPATDKPVTDKPAVGMPEDGKPVGTSPEAKKTDKVGGAWLDFSASTAVRIEATLFESGMSGSSRQPLKWGMYLKSNLCAQAQMGDWFFNLVYTVASEYYYSGSEFSMSSSYNGDGTKTVFAFGSPVTWVKESYGIWSPMENYNLLFGRFATKASRIRVTGMLWTEDVSVNGFGEFGLITKSGDMKFSYASVLAPFGVAQRTPGTMSPGFEWNYIVPTLLIIQPQMDMNIGENKLALGLGFWVVFNSNVINNSYGSKKVLVDGEMEDNHYIALNLNAAFTMDPFKFYLEFAANVGAPEENVGILLGMQYNQCSCKGTWQAGVELFFNSQWAPIQVNGGKFNSGDYGPNKKGIILKGQYMLEDSIYLALTIAARNKIKAGSIGERSDAELMVRFEIGMKIGSKQMKKWFEMGE